MDAAVCTTLCAVSPRVSLLTGHVLKLMMQSAVLHQHLDTYVRKHAEISFLLNFRTWKWHQEKHV